MKIRAAIQSTHFSDFGKCACQLESLRGADASSSAPQNLHTFLGAPQSIDPSSSAPQSRHEFLSAPESMDASSSAPQSVDVSSSAPQNLQMSSSAPQSHSAAGSPKSAGLGVSQISTDLHPQTAADLEIRNTTHNNTTHCNTLQHTAIQHNATHKIATDLEIAADGDGVSPDMVAAGR